MTRVKTIFVLMALVSLWLAERPPVSWGGSHEEFIAAQKERWMSWRKERDEFFKTHQRSPLSEKERKNFKGLTYYPFSPNYVFNGPIKRYVLNINNPEYYATFITNKGVNKRYIRYGKFRFQLDGKEHALEVYKSILSDALFIPFKDTTNGKETYEAGRYIDGEILNGYKMELDFNMAYYPLCAYNEKYTCVLPPRDNTLSISIRAGEKSSKPF